MKVLGLTSYINMSRRNFFQRQRYHARSWDTLYDVVTFGKSGSLFGRSYQDPAAMDGAWVNLNVANQPTFEFASLKSTARKDTILFSELRIPKYSKILGAYVELKTHPSSTPGNAFNGFVDVAFYPERSHLSDQDNWGGNTPTKNNQDFVWKHVALDSRPRTNTLITNGPNFNFRILEGVLTKGITPFASGSTSIGICSVGALVFSTDETSGDPGPIGTINRGYGNVVLIDTLSAACNLVVTRVTRVGTFTGDIPSVVCKIYNYNTTTRTMGTLRATSDPILCSSISTGAANLVTFTFTTTFAVTAGEHVLATVEPVSGWTQTAGHLNARYCSAMDNSTAGTNAAGSEEIIWWQPLNNGNRTSYFFTDELPVLYTGPTGEVVEDVPFNDVIETLRFTDDGPGPGGTYIRAVDTKYKLPFNEKMIKTLQNYVGQDESDGIMVYMAQGDNADAFSDGANIILWNPNVSAQNGLFVVYRSTRTFIC